MTARRLAAVPSPDQAAEAAARRWESEVQAYTVNLRAARKSPHTIQSYTQSLAAWRRFCEATGVSLDVHQVTRRDAQAFTLWLTDANLAPSTLKTRHVALATFFGWLASEDEGVLTASPFRGVPTPKVGERPIPTVPDDQSATLLASLSGRSFVDRRDLAIVAMMLSTGARRSEVGGLLLEDVDLVAGRVTIHGKGDRVRVVAFGDFTSTALRHYIRARAEHAWADEEFQVGDRDDTLRVGRPLWLVTPGTGHRGGLGSNGIHHMLNRRCRAANVPNINPHRFRHTWADAMLRNGQAEGDIMRLAGWKTRDMLERYAAHGAAERALVHYQDPLDKMVTRGRRGHR
jgi:site-specific recombinase XerD